MLLNIQNAADYLHLKKSYLYKLVSQGGIPHYKPRGRLYFLKEELDNWITREKSTDGLGMLVRKGGQHV